MDERCLCVLNYEFIICLFVTPTASPTTGGGAAYSIRSTMASRTIVSKRKETSKSGENFKVAVRVRPLIVREIRSNASIVSSQLSYN